MFENMTKKKKTTLILATLLIIGIAIVGIYFVLQSKPIVVAEGLAKVELAKYLDELNNQGIEYNLSPDGNQILVKNDIHQEAALRLANLQLNNEVVHGLEIYDDVEYGMTEHTQQVTYQRAIQGEIERTLANLTFVQRARVHITFAQKRLFKSSDNYAKAAVTLVVSPDEFATAEQIESIKLMVAASVAELAPNNVTVLDHYGKLLGNRLTENEETPANDGHYKQQKETLLSNKITKILALYFTKDQYAVSVDLTLERTKKKQVIQTILANKNNEGVVTRKKEKTTQLVTKANDNELEKNHDLDIEYMHGTQTEELEFLSGKVLRTSVAVALLVDIKKEELDKLTELVYSAAGLSESRGDLLTLNAFPPIISNSSDPAKVLEAQPKIATPKALEPKMATVIKHEETWLDNPSLYYLVLLILLLSNVIAFLFGKLKRLSKQEKQSLLISLNDLDKKEAFESASN